MNKGEIARDYFLKGYACSQAVALAFKELTGMTEGQIAAATLGFGGGIGRQRLTCGAVSGMVFIVGLVFYNAESSENKSCVYGHVRNVCNAFTEEFGNLACETLLSGAGVKVQKGDNPEHRTQEYYKKRPCDEIVYRAAEIIDKYIKENS